MKIIQMLPCLNYGDAIGNDVIAIHHALQANGYQSQIIAEVVDQRLGNDLAQTIDQWKAPKKDDIIIYHLSVGWKYINYVTDAKCRKICIYHNITPAHFYKNYDSTAYNYCLTGIEEVKRIAGAFDYCLADSDFNRQDLISYGFKCKIDVLPILIAFDDYKKEPGKGVIRKYKDTPGANILFVGRVVPNKMHEDLIRAFYLYKKYYDPDAKLFLVGRYIETDVYYRRLKGYIDALGVQDVIFPGHIKFNDILAYYSIADVFLCMSEHEGFCVPLVESMFFHVPILAYDSTAIASTLGGSGILFKEKNMTEVAGLIDRVVKDQDLRKAMIEGQDRRLKDFDNAVVMDMFLKYLKDFIAQDQ